MKIVIFFISIVSIYFVTANPLPNRSNIPAELPSEYVPNSQFSNSQANIDLIKSGNYKQNIESLGGQFEGDMILTNEQKRAVLGLDRTGIINPNARWPNNTIPYEYADGYFSDDHIEAIEIGLRTIEASSCLKFVKRTNEEHYVQVTGGDTGCHSQIGYLGEGRQNLNLQIFEIGVGCFHPGTVVHEFLHTLGFYHMQSATERDDWVKIEWDHIISGTESNFNKYADDIVTNFGVDYDVESVMHYNAYAFTKNGYATIVPYDISLIDNIGQRFGMTTKDIRRLNAIYKCDV